MERKLKQKLTQFAQENGLHFDDESETLYGIRSGYHLWVTREENTRVFLLAFSLTRRGEDALRDELLDALRDELQGELRDDVRGELLDELRDYVRDKVRDAAQDALRDIAAQQPALAGCTVQGHRVIFTFKGGISVAAMPETLRETLEQTTAELRLRGFEPCCQACGGAVMLYPCSVDGTGITLCAHCFRLCCQKSDLQGVREKPPKTENPAGGIIGALLGALAGAVCIVLLGRFGFLAALSGVVVGVCTPKGYELLGGKLRPKGAVICAVIMLAMGYLANRTGWAISLMQTLEVELSDAFRISPPLMTEGGLALGQYLTNLLMVYAFTLLGAAPTMRSALRRGHRRDLTPHKL